MTHSRTIAASRIALTALLLAAFPLRAQSPETAPLRQPEVIPFELAAALASAGGMSGEPQILVGSMPGWVADKIVVPANARILGSAFYGTTAVAILRIASPDDSLLADFKRELMKRGWVNPPPFPNFGGGFRSAVLSPTSPTRVSLCGNGQSLFASLARRQGATANMTVRIAAASPGTSNCFPTQMPVGITMRAMPTVYHPEGLTEARTGAECTRPQEVNRTSAVIKTSMTSVALLDHYGKQLQDSGWVASTRKTTTSALTFTRPDSAGTSRELTLSVTADGTNSSCRELMMNLYSGKAP